MGEIILRLVLIERSFRTVLLTYIRVFVYLSQVYMDYKISCSGNV